MEDRLTIHNSGGLSSLLLVWFASTMLLWFLAFYQMPSGSPEWLQRTQLACFGTDESGMPSAAGWIILTLGPISLLLALWVSFQEELASTCRYLYFTQLGRRVTFYFGILVLLEAGWIGGRIIERWEGFSRLTPALQQTEHFPENYPRLNKAAPAFNLVDQFGHERNIASFQGKPLLLSFVFAHCRAMCPLLVKVVSEAEKKIGPGKMNVAFITLDPWRDTPAALSGLAKELEFSDETFALSGPAETVEQVLDAYSIPRKRDKENGDVVHPAMVYLIDAHGQVAYIFNNPSAIWLSEAVARLIE